MCPRNLAKAVGLTLAGTASREEWVATRRFKYVGRGIYSLAEAERLSGVPRRRIRRWMHGYIFTYRGEKRRSPPPVASDIDQPDTTHLVGFADLLEVRFLNAFREYGVSWKYIRIAAERAQELLGRHHPFSSQIFRTDGRTILAELARETGDKLLLDLVKDQWEFERIISPYLYEGIDYNRLQEPERWWPLGTDRQVVIDPSRAFGAPIVSREGVPTRILAGAFCTEQSVELVAKWYEVGEQAVRDAVEFESRSTDEILPR
jgi:uncharacterized protein (DUF433 family)